jgi:hypothetical protein
MQWTEFTQGQSQQCRPIGGNALRNGSVHQLELLTVERDKQSVLHVIAYTVEVFG